MKKTDKNIDKFLHDHLPAPDVPADDAWTGMNNMLDAAASGAGAQGNTGGPTRLWKAIGKMKGLTMLSVTVITVGTIVGVILSQRNTPGIERRNTKPAASVAIMDSAGFEKIVTKEEISKDSAAFHNNKEASQPIDLAETNSRKEIASNPERDNAFNAKSALILPGNTAESTSKGTVNSTRGPSAEREHNVASRKNAPLSEARNEEHKQVSNRFISGTKNKKRIAYPVSSDYNAHENSIATTAAANPDASKLLAGRKPTLLQPRAANFHGAKPNLSFRVAQPAAPAPAKQARRISIFENLHFGPEWSLYVPVNGSDYLLTGADSIKRPARVAIPGIFISNNWGRHAATVVFTPLHTYFGNNDRVAQRVDTIRLSDSTSINFYHTTKFIKATGINISLQYQFEATSWLSISGGASYARYSRALIQSETTNSYGTTIVDPLLTTKSREATDAFIHPQQWTVRAGLIAHPRQLLNGRVQVGTNMILPVSNLSRYEGTRIRSANAQVFLRLMIR